jgi:hypothetical protein
MCMGNAGRRGTVPLGAPGMVNGCDTENTKERGGPKTARVMALNRDSRGEASAYEKNAKARSLFHSSTMIAWCC